MYSSERRAAELAAADKAEVEKLVARMEAEMKAAAKQLEFERAAAIRDEIQQIRLRVLEQDASVVVARAAERAATGRGAGGEGAGGGAPAGGARSRDEGASLEVTEVTVLPAGEEPDGDGGEDAAARTAARAVPGHPRRARRRRRLAGPLAGPAHLGRVGHAQHPPADRPATADAPPAPGY